MTIIHKGIECKNCGRIACNLHFEEEHKREISILFTRCPKCDDGISVDMENIVVGELVEVAEV